MADATPDFGEFNVEPERLPPLPSGCEDCPEQCRRRAELSNLFFTKNLAENMLGGLTGEMGQQFNDHIDANFPEEEAEEYKLGARQSASSTLDQIDEKIAANKGELLAIEAVCCGALKMRAPKEGKEYTVGICTSDRIYPDNAVVAAHVDAHVRVRKLQKP